MDTIEISIGDFQRHAFERFFIVTTFFFKICRFFIHFNFKEKTNKPHRKQNTTNTKRIGHGVGHPHVRRRLRHA